MSDLTPEEIADLLLEAWEELDAIETRSRALKERLELAIKTVMRGQRL